MWWGQVPLLGAPGTTPVVAGCTGTTPPRIGDVSCVDCTQWVLRGLRVVCSVCRMSDTNTNTNSTPTQQPHYTAAELRAIAAAMDAYEAMCKELAEGEAYPGNLHIAFEATTTANGTIGYTDGGYIAFTPDN